MQPGDSLAHFLIQDQIGSGGMGAVFRATDTRLGRDVALKILPPAFAADLERLARFRREAQVLAALQHPNIASIYGIESDRDQTFLVMELCDGEDLSAILNRGPVPVEEARDIARQIALGLEEAHEKGIIHRDLKPANVKVSAEGKVKILDFGLARTLREDTDTGEVSGETLTVAASMTRPGVVLGTAAYMSPEQARGKGIDKRTDIWAFGVILYEMLTGRRLFAGETVSDILASVLRHEPDFDALPQDLPVEIAYVVRRCLDRNRESRLRDIGEARCLVSEEASASSLSLLAMPAHAATTYSRSIKGWLWPAATALAIVALGLILITGRAGGLRNSDAPLGFTQLTTQGGPEYHGATGPDGNFFVYAARGGEDFDIFLKRAGGLNPINLTEDSDSRDEQPALSPDGQSIAFTSDREGGGVYLMGATGESARLLAHGGSYPAWSPGGDLVAYSTENFRRPWSREETSAIWVVDTAGKNPRKIPIEIDAIQPAWSPGGDRLAFWSVKGESGQRDLWTVRPDGAGLTQVTDDSSVDFCPVWSRDGRWLLFLSNRGGTNNLWRIRVDDQTGEPSGEPELMTLPSPDVRHFSLSPDGLRLVFTSVRIDRHLYRVPFDPDALAITGKPQPLLNGSMDVGNISISSGGDWIAFMRGGKKEDLYLLHTDGTGLRQLTDDVHRDRGPSWYDSDRRLIFYSDRGGKYDLWSIRSDGADLRRLTDLQGRSLWFPAEHPSGEYIIGIDEDGTARLDWNDDKTALGDPQPIATDPEGRFRFFGRQWSPDGRYLLGWSAVTINALEDRLTAFDTERGDFLHIADDVGSFPVRAWLGVGRVLIYHKSDGIHAFDLESRDDVMLLADEDFPGVVEVEVDPTRRWLYALKQGIESDLWMAEFPE